MSYLKSDILEKTLFMNDRGKSYINGVFSSATLKLKDRKCSLSGKNYHSALWHYRNSHNVKCGIKVTATM
jgi:hypothetical protein